ncbi:MAG TPA: cyclic nucleotide-binding domain-containing protein [Gaiellaceae bacterium]|nr:cyclic nucleotide-binding domain-containing protein [Gaiellaceae bacterium]
MDRSRPDIVESLARLALFADLPQAQLESIAHRFDEEVFAEGQRILRTGLSGGGLYLIIEGEALIRINGQERARFGPGEFFGEIGVLLGEPPNADVEAATFLRCLEIPGAEVEPFLVEFPRVMYRMLQSEARRLRTTTEWKT